MEENAKIAAQKSGRLSFYVVNAIADGCTFISILRRPLFLYPVSANPRTSNSPLRTKFRYQIVTEKPTSDYCNDFHANSLIFPLLSQFCLLVIQLITFPFWHCVTIVTKNIKTDAVMSKFRSFLGNLKKIMKYVFYLIVQ